MPLPFSLPLPLTGALESARASSAGKRTDPFLSSIHCSRSRGLSRGVGAAVEEDAPAAAVDDDDDDDDEVEGPGSGAARFEP